MWLLVLFLVCGFWDVSAQTPELDQMFNQALSNLESSANRIDSLQSELNESKNYVTNLEMLSEEQKSTLLRQGTVLEQQSISLKNINADLTTISEQLRKAKQDLLLSRRIILVLGIVFSIGILLKVLGIVLYLKGIKVPRFIDVLL